MVGLISIGDIVKWRVREFENGAGSAARLHQDRLNDGLKQTRQSFFSIDALIRVAATGARMWIASWMESMARSAARAPNAIRSLGAVEIEPADLTDTG